MSEPSNSDRFLVKRLNEGDESAFDTLFMKLHHQVFLYCLKLTKSREVAEEIMQDVFIKVWEKREKINPQFPIGSFIFKITRDLCINYLKKVSREKSFKEELKNKFENLTSDHTENQVIYDDYYRIASFAISQLPTQRKKIFEMNRIMGLSNEEIARRLGISKNTVKVQLSKASKFVKAYFTAHTDVTMLLAFLLLN